MAFANIVQCSDAPWVTFDCYTKQDVYEAGSAESFGQYISDMVVEQCSSLNSLTWKSVAEPMGRHVRCSLSRVEEMATKR